MSRLLHGREAESQKGDQVCVLLLRHLREKSRCNMTTGGDLIVSCFLHSLREAGGLFQSFLFLTLFMSL